MAENYQIDVYKCPNCASVVNYDPRTKKYVCESCDKQFSPEYFRHKEVASLHGYTCPECGAELMGDEPTASVSCPYCGNNEVAVSKFSGPFEPDFVIPFQLDLNAAEARYKEFTASREYLPDDFVERSRIVSAKGVYVPYWLFSGQVDFDITYRVKEQNGDSTTKLLSRRVGKYEYKRVPADASVKMPNDMMDSINPYRFTQMQPFTTKYMPGFLAERYTESYKETWDRVGELLTRSTLKKIEHSIGFDTSVSRYDVFSTDPEKRLEQVLLPVWLFSISYGDKKYLAGVNGQTGSVAMNYPIDEKKRSKHVKRTALTNALIACFIALSLVLPFFAMTSAMKDFSTVLVFTVGLVAFVALVGFVAIRYGMKTARQEIADNMEHVKDMENIDGYLLENTLSLSQEEDAEVFSFTLKEVFGSNTSEATGDVRIGGK